MIRSLRMRLFLGVTAASALTLGALSVGIDEAVHHTLQGEFDSVLLEKARTIASLVEQTGAKTHFDYQPVEFPEFDPGPKAAYFEITLDGKAYAHSASLGAGHLPLEARRERTPEAHGVTLPDGRQGRMLVMAFEPLADDPTAPPPKDAPLPQGMVAVAQDNLALQRTMGRIHLLLLGLGGAATLLSGALLVWVAGRTIRPVGALARQIEGLRETDLATVIPARELPTELAPIADRLNGLLRRLAEAFDRERAFTADVAHELRTPLAGILATLQVARSRPREAPGYETAIDKSLAILLQMQGLVENLLLLARADSGQLSMRTGTVALPLLVEECAAAFEEAAARRGLRFERWEREAAAAADREFLRVVLCNLLDNAVSYAEAGGVIRLRVFAEGTLAVVEIANAGAALTAEDLPNLLKRFVRKDAARAGTGTHAGLGLSICQRLLALQKGRLALRLEAGQLVARVEMPGATDPGVRAS